MEDREHPAYPSQHEGNAFVALLSDRRTFADFIRAFVDVGALKPRLRFDAATLLGRRFITEVLREGERDVLWKVPIEGGELFLVLLLEHQSSVDHGMPMRLLLYMSALWHDHYHRTDPNIRRSRRFRPPPIIPVVLYTGDGVWTGATRLRELFACNAELEGLLPDFRFQVINFAALGDEQFAAPGNFACAILHVVWALVTGVSGDEFARIFEELRPFWGVQELKLLGAFICHYARAEGRPDAADIVYNALMPKEERMSNPEVVRKRFWEVWAEEGRVIGEARGQAEGEARKELQNLREQTEAIRAFFTRKGLPWDSYRADVERLPCHREAADFLVDLATAADMTAFLKERFGH